MVVATPEGFDKKSYRTFNIKNSEITNDDFAMMKEVLTRRFNRMAPENRPDVILLDGGLGQLHAVHEALKDFDVKDFEEYFQSEQWNDCCDIANVEINIM